MIKSGRNTWIDKIDVGVKLTGENSKILKQASEQAAGSDFYASGIDCSRLRTHGQIIYNTGVSLELPEGYVGLIFPRSSIRGKQLRLTNSVGVLDSDYRGEITFTFDFTGPMAVQGMDARPLHQEQVYQIGDRIGQLVIVPVEAVNFVQKDFLSDTQRGQGGYGSTGRS